MMYAECSKKDGNGTRTREDGYESLAAAVVGQAISDYYYVLLRTRIRDDPVEMVEKHRLERFFRSQRFMLFSDFDGVSLMRLTQRKVDGIQKPLRIKNAEWCEEERR